METEKKSFDLLNFEKAEWTKIKEELSLLEWNNIFTQEMSVESMCLKLEEKLLTCSAKYCPERKQATKNSSIPRNRLKLIRKRKKLRTKLNYEIYVKKQIMKVR